MQTAIQDIKHIQSQIKNSLNDFEALYVRVVDQDTSMAKNNQIIIPNLIKLFSKSLKPLELFLRFLDNNDLLSFASSCRTIYKLFYSPLGFKFLRHLRPVIVRRQKKEELPYFSQTTLQQLCKERSLKDVDEDDKMAIILTIKTNILATRQKVGELDILIQEYDRRSEKILQKILYLGGQREEQIRKNSELNEQIEKLRELLKVSEGHADSLKEEQEKMILQRQTKILQLTEEKEKLERQKELLIKKIKSQQKEKEEGLVYAKQVSRILNRLNQITAHSKK